MANLLLDDSGITLLDESGAALADESYVAPVGVGGYANASIPGAASDGTGLIERTGAGAPSFGMPSISGVGSLSWGGSGAPTIGAVPTVVAWGRPSTGGSAAVTVGSVEASGTGGAIAAIWRSASGSRITLPTGLTVGQLGILFDFATLSGGSAYLLQDESGDVLTDESGGDIAQPGGYPPDEVVPDGWTRLDGASYQDANDASTLVVSYRVMSPDLDGYFVDGMAGDGALKLLMIFDMTASGIEAVTFRQADAIQAGTGGASSTVIERATYDVPLLGVAVKAVRAASGGLTPTLDTSPSGGFDQPVSAYVAEDYVEQSMAIEVNHLVSLSGSPADATIATADDGDTQFFSAFLLEFVFGASGSAGPSLPVVSVVGLGGINSVARIEACVIQRGVGVVGLLSGTTAEVATTPVSAQVASGERLAEVIAGASVADLAGSRNQAEDAEVRNAAETEGTT